MLSLFAFILYANTWLADGFSSVSKFYFFLLAACEQYPVLYPLLIWGPITGIISFAQAHISARWPRVWIFLQRTGLDAYGVWIWARKKWPAYVPQPPPPEQAEGTVEITTTQTAKVLVMPTPRPSERPADPAPAAEKPEDEPPAA